MAQSKSSHRWLKEHFSDEYVKRSKQEGYRSRACYKLIELDEKFALLNNAKSVIDLGAAPGGWSQVVAQRLGKSATLIASDILSMEPLDNVTFVQGDFTEEEVYHQIMQLVGQTGADLVISDMAPNLSGVKDIDQPRTMLLVELAYDLAVKTLRPGGAFVSKIFHGEGFDDFVRQCRQQFDQVKAHKPKASRARSPEVYLVAQGFKNNSQAQMS